MAGAQSLVDDITHTDTDILAKILIITRFFSPIFYKQYKIFIFNLRKIFLNLLLPLYLVFFDISSRIALII